jgi:hypothetical protein
MNACKWLVKNMWKKENLKATSLKREVWFEEEAKVFVIYHCHAFATCE